MTYLSNPLRISSRIRIGHRKRDSRSLSKLEKGKGKVRNVNQNGPISEHDLNADAAGSRSLLLICQPPDLTFPPPSYLPYLRD